MPRLPVLLACLLTGLSATGAASERRTPILLPCEDCEGALDGLPKDLPAITRIAPAGEPGTALRLTGIVRDRHGQPRAGVIVYAHQTDALGVYPPLPTAAGEAAMRHGRLRGWARTDAAGRYTFDTIRPGRYPQSDMPAHIHLYIVAPGCALYYIDDVQFEDDPALTPAKRRASDIGRGGRGIVMPVLRNGVWQVSRDIALGRNVRGYPRCAP